MKKYIVFLLFIAVIFGIFTLRTVSSELNDETSATDITEETTSYTEALTADVTLGYYEDKSLNPFTTTSPTNRRLMTLVYDSLFILSESYTPESLIAEEYFLDDNVLTVNIRTDIYFSDGSPITPSDVVYSFNEAKNSSGYKGLLTNFTAATAGTETVIFTLAKKNINCCNCLIFPIVKYGTADQPVPVGSGRYTFVSKQDTYYLHANEGTSRNEEMSLKEINLIPITSENKELYLLQTGDLSFFFDDLTDGEYLKIGANTATVSLNNMLYLGINSNKAVLQDKDLLSAINYALDRDELLQSCYGSMGQAVAQPFNPQWEKVKDLSLTPTKKDTALADEFFKKSGYIYAYTDNKYRSKNFEFLELTMIVNSESEAKLEAAKLIKSQLKAAGIDVTLSEMTYDEYTEALYKGNYDLYVGEVKLSPDMDLSCFFSEGGSTGYGVDSDSTCAEAYYDFASGKIDITTFLQVFNLERPFIPLLYRNAVAYYSRELTYEDSISEYEIFENIYSWELR